MEGPGVLISFKTILSWLLLWLLLVLLMFAALVARFSDGRVDLELDNAPVRRDDGGWFSASDDCGEGDGVILVVVVVASTTTCGMTTASLSVSVARRSFCACSIIACLTDGFRVRVLLTAVVLDTVAGAGDGDPNGAKLDRVGPFNATGL